VVTGFAEKREGPKRDADGAPKVVGVVAEGAEEEAKGELAAGTPNRVPALLFEEAAPPRPKFIEPSSIMSSFLEVAAGVRVGVREGAGAGAGAGAIKETGAGDGEGEGEGEGDATGATTGFGAGVGMDAGAGAGAGSDMGSGVGLGEGRDAEAGVGSGAGVDDGATDDVVVSA